MYNNFAPPKWAPSAIATDQGWVNPKTGELLISLKGLKTRIEMNKPSVELDIKVPDECPIETAFVKLTIEETPEVSNEVKEEPVVVIEKRGKGRPKKIQTAS